MKKTLSMGKTAYITGDYKTQLVREREAICRFLNNVDDAKAMASMDGPNTLLKMLDYDEECKSARLVEIDAMIKLLS